MASHSPSSWHGSLLRSKNEPRIANLHVTGKCDEIPVLVFAAIFRYVAVEFPG